jgi:hypothetical protein
MQRDEFLFEVFSPGSRRSRTALSAIDHRYIRPMNVPQRIAQSLDMFY